MISAVPGFGAPRTSLEGQGATSGCGPGMTRGAMAIAMICFGLGAAAQEKAATGDERVIVPSGQDVRYLDTVQSAPGPEGLTIRFRFVAPAIARDGATVDVEAAQADMEVLCNEFALPRLPATGPAPAQIIISLSDRAVAFGEPAPEATQFFEAYTIIDGRCQWEPF